MPTIEEKSQRLEDGQKPYGSILNDAYILSKGASLLIITGTPTSRAIFVESYGNDGQATINAIKIHGDIRKPRSMTTFSMVPDHRSSRWEKVTFSDSASAKEDFEKLNNKSTHYHSRLCESSKDLDKFLSSFKDLEVLSYVDDAINRAYREAFKEPLHYMKASTSSGCSLM